MSPESDLGHYRILSQLGRGGMGEVYLAEDTRLHRNVALKVLPATMAADPNRRKRFEREAQAVAALNHPNIVTVHSVEEASGVMFLTMEAVEGRTLEEMMASGALPVHTILRVVAPVSDALAAAHQRGITHRDLKPSNVMVTVDDRVKVLDFGLAKLREVGREPAPDEPTKLRSDNLTGEGRIMGTVAYMSPEQAEGKTVDQRSDIFSLGVMLHEMAVGERPFKGETDLSILSSILKDTPNSITDIRPDLPAGLARIVRRCLAKDPTRRYQTATDLRNDLDELKQDLDSRISSATPGTPAPTTAGRAAVLRGQKPWLVVAGVVLALAVAAGIFVWQGAADLPTEGVAFTPDRSARLTSSGTANIAAISPDGRYVVHVKLEGEQPSVWVRQTATTSDVRIVPPADVRYDGLIFSPDGNYIYYVAYPPRSGIAGLYRIPTLGGGAIRVLEDIDGSPGFSPDGRSFAFVRGVVKRGSQLLVASAEGRGERRVAVSSSAVRFLNEAPAWSPDGRTILVPAVLGPGKMTVAAVDAATGTIRNVGGTWQLLHSVAWMPDGRSFLIDGIDDVSMTTPQVWQVMYPSGVRRRVTNDLNGYVGVSLSADGRLLATVQSADQARIWIASADARDAREIPIEAGRNVGTQGLSWTPDRRLLFTAEAAGYIHVWIARDNGSEARQLTSGESHAIFPIASHDGRWIYYTVSGSDGARIWRMGIDGSDQKPLTAGPSHGPIVSPDGAWIYYTRPGAGHPTPMKMNADGSGASVVSDVAFIGHDISSDGTLLLGRAWNDAQRRTECVILPVSGGALQFLGEQATIEATFVRTCHWTQDGTSVAYVSRRDGVLNVFSRPLGGGPERQLTYGTRDSSPVVFAGDWSRDGRLAVSRGTTTSDVVLISAR